MRVIKIAFNLVAVSSITLLLASCGSTPPEPPQTNLPEVTQKIRERADKFQKMLAPNYANSMIIDSSTIDSYRKIPYTLAQRLVLLGIKYVHIRFDLDIVDSKQKTKELKTLLAAMKNNGITPNILVSDKRFYTYKSKDWDKTPKYWLYDNRHPMKKLLDAIGKFNTDNFDPSTKIDGITVIFSPDYVNKRQTSYPTGALYEWTDQGYGKGNDNDKLVQTGILNLWELKKRLHNMRMVVVVPDFLERKVKAGQLSFGKTSDFLQFCDDVIIEIFVGSSLSKTRSYAAASLKPVKTAGRVSIALRTVFIPYQSPLTLKSFVDSDWTTLLRKTGSLQKSFKQYKAFMGFTFDNYYGIERLLEK
ncbi:hypothetical protein P0136_03025 [Lentisphaerota bacterium ZTH]|nr:hypothetical protein JYG24_05835 [Lentisphaerota bacterium]WET06975.1 hypothetical protein P0136_03025 [Lentisphaerota bacterium ZTH]